MANNLVNQFDESEIYASGLAMVVIPTDVDRGKYIADCYKSSTVSIYSAEIGYRNRVPIDRYSINFIKFPLKSSEFGSTVSFKTDAIRKKPSIDGIYFGADELCDLKENQFKFKRDLNGNSVEVVGSPDGKYLALNVSADVAGEVHINVRSLDESGKVVIDVDGSCEITSLTDSTIKQYGKLSLVTSNRNDETEFTTEEHTSQGRTIYTNNDVLNCTDSKINTDTQTVNASKTLNVNTPSLIINNGNQNFVLGQLFKTFLSSFVNQVASSTVMVNGTPTPLLNAVEIASFNNQIDSFLSKVAFIDK